MYDFMESFLENSVKTRPPCIHNTIRLNILNRFEKSKTQKEFCRRNSLLSSLLLYAVCTEVPNKASLLFSIN